jgi:hypothetical protein
LLSRLGSLRTVFLQQRLRRKNNKKRKRKDEEKSALHSGFLLWTLKVCQCLTF